MSKETIGWLNQNTMLGNIGNREQWKQNGWGMFDENTQTFKAWWDNGTFENGYDGFIPVEEVQRVLFNWEPVEAPIFLRKPVDEDESDGMDGLGNHFMWVPDTAHKAIIHPETNHVYGHFGTDSYQVHGYTEWLINNVSQIVDGEVGIDSAGLLRNGGVAYVSISLPDGVTTASGFKHKTSLLASTSTDGTKATTYSIVELIALCDNSMNQAESGAFKALKIKHSSRSLGRLNDARQALGLIYENSDKFTKFIDSLAEVDVTDAQFRQIIAGLAPMPDPATNTEGKLVNQRGITIAERKQAELWNLWSSDPRAAQWNGTLLGAFQSANTWSEHFRSHNDNQVERVMLGTLNGTFEKADREFWAIVAGVEGLDLRAMVKA